METVAIVGIIICGLVAIVSIVHKVNFRTSVTDKKVDVRVDTTLVDRQESE